MSCKGLVNANMALFAYSSVSRVLGMKPDDI